MIRELINLVEEKSKDELALHSLPYKKTELDPVMSKRTLDYHYSKLAAGYVKRYNANDFHLLDLTGIVRKDWTVRFTNEILNRNLKISWQLPVGTRTAIIDKEITRLLMKSGCRNISFGAESGSKKVLDKMDKELDTVQMEKAIKTTLKSKINICLFFLIGF